MVGRTGEHGDQVTPARCQVIFDGSEDLDDAEDPVAEASVTYTAGMLGPFVGVKVLSFTNEIAEDRFDRVLDALSECPKFTIDDGQTVTPFRVSALSFPNYGQESAALRMSASSEGGGVRVGLRRDLYRPRRRVRVLDGDRWARSGETVAEGREGHDDEPRPRLIVAGPPSRIRPSVASTCTAIAVAFHQVSGIGLGVGSVKDRPSGRWRD